MKSEGMWAQSALAIVVIASAIACNSGGQPTKTPSTDFIFAGLYSPGATTGNAGCGLAETLGDPNADATFQAEVNTQLSFWNGVPANVHYWNDCHNPNSVSLPTGDILYGVNLFQALVTSYRGDSGPISGVLAHEWGHQVQFDYGWMSSNQPTADPIELAADAFSGYYMALGERSSWGSISDFFSGFGQPWQLNFNDLNHHGTPQERSAAAQLGFQTALQAISMGIPLSYSDIYMASFRQPWPDLASDSFRQVPRIRQKRPGSWPILTTTRSSTSVMARARGKMPSCPRRITDGYFVRDKKRFGHFHGHWSTSPWTKCDRCLQFRRVGDERVHEHGPLVFLKGVDS